MIEGGAERGSNLFHSFLEFNVEAGQRVYFASPLGIESILSRVTGGNPSNIFGTLGVAGTADLFLMNPNGMVFGENATLDIPGAFYGTTADAIPLGDEGLFSAIDPEQSTLLTVRPEVSFFNYLTAASGDIESRGALAAGENLTLAGNRLELQGQVAAGADLTLLGREAVQIRDAADVPFIGFAGGDLLVQGNEQVDIVALSHPDSGLYSYGDMVLRSANPVGGDAHYWSAGNFWVETLDGEAGDLFSPVDPIIRAFGDVEIAGYGGSSLHILAGGAVTIGIAVIAAPDPGVIGIDFLQETIELSDGTLVEVDGSIQPTLDIRAGVSPEALDPSPLENPSGLDPFDLFLDTQFQISAPNILDTPSSADITVSNVLIPNDRGLVLLTNQYKPNLALVGGDISIPNLGSLDFGIEAAGSNAYIDSRRDVDISNSGVDTSDTAEAGSIYIAGRNLLANSSNLDASNDEVGNAGNISISFSEDIDYQGRIASDSGDDGAGGNISLSANNIYFSGNLTAFSKADDINRNSINVSARNDLDLQINPSLFFVPPLDAASGDFEISGNDVSIRGSNLFFTSGILLDAGDISIDARQNLQIRDSLITTFAVIGDGNAAGDIILSGGNIDLLNTSFSAETGIGDNFPGLISFDAENRLSINGGFISVITGSGFGGNILLSADHFEANDTLIDARVIGVDGGEIFINVSGLAEISSSEITASTIRESGKAGTVRVNAENLILSDGSDLNSSSSLGLFGLSSGDAGEVILDIDDELIMSNSSISSFSETSGDAGSVTVDVGSNILLENSRASSFTASSGNAGIIRVEAENLTLNNNSELNSSSLMGTFDFSSGDAGEVILDIDNDLIMSNSSISSFSETSGDAGSVTMYVGDNFLLDNSRASSFTASSGNAGIIRVEAENLTLNNNSELNSSSLTGAFDLSSGDAGEVILDIDNDLIMSNSSIRSFSETSGDAGSVTGNFSITAGKTVDV